MSFNKLKIYPYKMGSQSAKELANVLNVKRVRPDGNYVPRRGHVVVNWGSSKVPEWTSLARSRGVTILNRPELIENASNKLKTFQLLSGVGVRVPSFTTDIDVAREWLNGGDTVVERHKLSASSGEGIRIVCLDDPDVESNLLSAPLYTKFMSKQREFRVHVFKGEVIDYAEKKKRKDVGDEFDKHVCSNERGWVFCRNNIAHIESVKQEAVKAVSALGLDFAAVDVILVDETPYILETNTSPGLMGTTLKKYTNRIKKYIGLPVEDDTDSFTPTVESASARTESDTFEESVEDELVTFKLDKITARKLKTLLSSLDV